MYNAKAFDFVAVNRFHDDIEGRLDAIDKKIKRERKLLKIKMVAFAVGLAIGTVTAAYHQTQKLNNHRSDED